MYCNHAFYFGATAENYEILEISEILQIFENLEI